MAIQKLSLRRKGADATQEAGEEQAEAPKKQLLKKAVAAPAEEEEEEETPAPKKVLVKKRLGGGPAAEEEEVPAPKKALKKVAPPAEEEEEEEEPNVEDRAEEEEEEVPAPKKALKKVAPPVEEEEEEEEAPAPKKTLAKRPAAPEPDEEAPSDRAVVSYQPQSFGSIDGPVDARDLMRPRINMVQANSSDLEEKGFSLGQIVLNGEILIWDKGFDPLNLILLTGRKKFVQKLSDEEYKEGVIPLIFDSPEAVAEAGFSTEWDGDEPPTVDPALFALFLLEQPEFIEPDPIFNLSYEDRVFALAEMKFTGVNYRASTAGKWLITQSRTSLAPDTRHYMLAFNASREKQKKSGNIVTVANFKNLGKHKDPKFLDWVCSLG